MSGKSTDDIYPLRPSRLMLFVDSEVELIAMSQIPTQRQQIACPNWPTILIEHHLVAQERGAERYRPPIVRTQKIVKCSEAAVDFRPTPIQRSQMSTYNCLPIAIPLTFGKQTPVRVEPRMFEPLHCVLSGMLGFRVSIKRPLQCCELVLVTHVGECGDPLLLKQAMTLLHRSAGWRHHVLMNRAAPRLAGFYRPALRVFFTPYTAVFAHDRHTV